MNWRIISIATAAALIAILYGAMVAGRRKTTVTRQSSAPRQGLKCKACGKSLQQDGLLGPASDPRCPHCGGSVRLEG